jgi:hypothetical protein
VRRAEDGAHAALAHLVAQQASAERLSDEPAAGARLGLALRRRRAHLRRGDHFALDERHLLGGEQPAFRDDQAHGRAFRRHETLRQLLLPEQSHPHGGAGERVVEGADGHRGILAISVARVARVRQATNGRGSCDPGSARYALAFS